MNISVNYIRFYVIELHFIGYIRDYYSLADDSFDNSIPYDSERIDKIFFSEPAAKVAFDNFDIYDYYSDNELLDADDIIITLEEWSGSEYTEAEQVRLIAQKSVLPKEN